MVGHELFGAPRGVCPAGGGDGHVHERWPLCGVSLSAELLRVCAYSGAPTMSTTTKMIKNSAPIPKNAVDMVLLRLRVSKPSQPSTKMMATIMSRRIAQQTLQVTANKGVVIGRGIGGQNELAINRGTETYSKSAHPMPTSKIQSKRSAKAQQNRLAHVYGNQQRQFP